MMSFTNQSLLVVALVVASGSCAAAKPSSSEAAKEMVPEFLGKLYTVVDTPVIEGKKAIIKATLANLNCTLTLVPHATANPSGWVVEIVDCKK